MRRQSGGSTVLPGIAGIALGVAIGAFCRLIDIPVPAPAHFIGAVILVAMTLGAIVAGRIVGAP
jgi:XapX domain-containing protein